MQLYTVIICNYILWLYTFIYYDCIYISPPASILLLFHLFFALLLPLYDILMLLIENCFSISFYLPHCHFTSTFLYITLVLSLRSKIMMIILSYSKLILYWFIGILRTLIIVLNSTQIFGFCFHILFISQYIILSIYVSNMKCKIYFSFILIS